MKGKRRSERLLKCSGTPCCNILNSLNRPNTGDYHHHHNNNNNNNQQQQHKLSYRHTGHSPAKRVYSVAKKLCTEGVK
jgi:hypothetical protein